LTDQVSTWNYHCLWKEILSQHTIRK